jgi:group I intron endonuclease
MPKMKALLKYGYNNFALIIIEYNNRLNISERETFLIQQLKPYYNVLLEGYRSTGYKHTEKIKHIIRIKAKGRKHSSESKKLISNSLKRDKNPFFGKRHSQETKKLISSRKSKRLIYVYNSMLNLLIVFSSLTKFAKLIFSTNNTLKDYMYKNKLFRGN